MRSHAEQLVVDEHVWNAVGHVEGVAAFAALQAALDLDEWGVILGAGKEIQECG